MHGNSTAHCQREDSQHFWIATQGNTVCSKYIRCASGLFYSLLYEKVWLLLFTASCTSDMWELHCGHPWYNILFNFFALCSSFVLHMRFFYFSLLIIILPLSLTHLSTDSEACRSSDQVMSCYIVHSQGWNLISVLAAE